MKKTYLIFAISLVLYAAYFSLRLRVDFLGEFGFNLSIESTSAFFLGILVIIAAVFKYGNVVIEKHMPSFHTVVRAASIVIIEELIFRAIILSILFSVLSEVLSVVLTSIIFGLCHKRHGTNYIFIATLAGLFYGYSFIIGNIELAMAQHLIINLLRYLMFSREAPKRQNTYN